MTPSDGRDRKQHEGISRRSVFTAGAGAGAALAFGGLTAAPAAAAERRDNARGGPGERLRLVNGKIHTMDPGNRVVSSVVIAGGRFAAVGPGGGDDGGSGPATTIDLRGRTVVPG